MAAIANVQLTDTFNTWRVRTNQGFTRLNQFATSESVFNANTVQANVTLEAVSGSANTNIFSDHLNVTANTELKGANTDITGHLLATSNVVFHDNLLVTSNVVITQNVTASFFFGDGSNLTGLASAFNNLSGTIANNQFGDSHKISSNVVFNGTTFQANNWTIERANFNIVAGRNYFANVGGGDTGHAGASIVATLPTAAVIGDQFRVIIQGDANNNPFTISRNGHRIQGELANLSVTTVDAGFGLVYMSANAGWRLEEV